MNHSSKVGLSFGTTSGVITTLGLIVGLTASEASSSIIIGGVLTIAFADAFSDALGIHISEESEEKHSRKEIWISTFSTYITKLLIALTFLVPLLYFSATFALIISILWGIVLLSALSYLISRRGRKLRTIIEHLLIALLVIVAGFVIGQYIRSF